MNTEIRSYAPSPSAGLICGSKKHPERQFIPYVSYVPNGQDMSLAREVSRRTIEEQDKMLPKSPEQILKFFRNGASVVLFDASSGNFVGHAAITEEHGVGDPNESHEIGSVIVGGDYRGNGAGKQLLREIKRQGDRNPAFREAHTIAFANEESLGLFLKSGYEAVEDPETLHSDVWKPCADCVRPKAENALCCDTPVTLVK